MRPREKGFLLLIVFIVVPFYVLRIYTATHDFVEVKYDTWNEAETAGVFHELYLPSNVPKSAYDIMISHDEEMNTYWGAFYVHDRESIQELVSGYQMVDREEFRKLNFPHPSGFPWGRGVPRLADLESYDGRKEKVEYYNGHCDNNQRQSVVVFNGYDNEVFYGCAHESKRSDSIEN